MYTTHTPFLTRKTQVAIMLGLAAKLALFGSHTTFTWLVSGLW
jgi:hypothetical protein